MKLTPVVNFINILRTAFMLVDPKSIKDTYDLTVFFSLSGSMSVKAECRMLLKLTADLQRLQGYRIISIIILREQNNLLKGFLANVVRIVPKCHDFKVLFLIWK